MPPDLTLLALDLLEQRIPFCQVTVVVTGTGAPVVPGAKLLVQHDGAIHGQVGSQSLTAGLAQDAIAQLEAGEIRLARFNSAGEPLPERRSLRGATPDPGVVEVVLEPMLPPDQLIIVGAGHIAVPLAHLATLVGFEVTVIDDRERFASRDRFPDAREVIAADFDTAISRQQITPWTYLVLVTRGHEHDEATLQKVVESAAPYIGMIGSRRRVLVVFDRLRALGVPEHFIRRIYAPIGLDIGARTAEEIALAITAEIINVKRRGRAPSLAHLLRRLPVDV